MGHDPRSNSSSAVVTVAVVAVLFLFMMGLFVVGAGLWFFRASALKQEMLEQRSIAMRQEVLARESAAKIKHSLTTAEATESGTGISRLVTIKIDQEGNVRFDDERMSLADLQTSLRSVLAEQGSEIRVQIQVDQRCKAAQIVDVVTTCNEVGVERFRMQSLSEPAEKDN